MTLLYCSMLVLYKLLGVSVSLFVGRPPCFDIEKVAMERMVEKKLYYFGGKKQL